MKHRGEAMKIPSVVVLVSLAMAPSLAFAEDAAAPSAGDLCDRLAGHPADVDLPADVIPLYLGAIDVAKAEPACRQAVSEKPDERRYLFELARVLRLKKEYPEALDLYQKASDKGSLIAMIGIALNYEQGVGVEQSYEKAVAQYERAIAAGSAAAADNLGNLYDYGTIGDGPDPAKAFELYSKAAADGNMSAVVDLARLYETGRGVAKDDAKAEALYRTAIASKDRDASAKANNELAWHFAMLGTNLAEAEKLALASVEGTLPGNDWAKGVAFDSVAWIRHLLGRDDEALRAQKEAIALAGDDAALYERLGDIHLALGNEAEAVAAWRQALELDPPNAIDNPDFDPEKIRKKIEAAS
jgi:tetratricopeptide (TPR) repeat protein